MRGLIRGVLALAVVGALFWFVAPREGIDFSDPFDPEQLGTDLPVYLAAQEARFDDITPGTEKRIHWAAEPGMKTALSVVYLHGYSATSQEIRPVPDDVAAAMGANIFFARLAGHGRGGDAMAEPRAGDWIRDTVEALEIGRRIGDRVLVIGTSTGSTLAAIAAADPSLTADMMQKVAGMVFLSPNFGLNNPAAAILEMPLARYWGPLVAGRERSFETRNPDHGTYWTSRYPTVSLMPLGALIRHARGLDYGLATVPALFLLSDADQVVRADISREVAAAWGGGATLVPVTLNPDDDPYHHVIAGDILSPGQTEDTVQEILDWLDTLPR